MSTRTRKRFARRPPDLTSLFDVLFIVVFVALIRAAAAEQALAKAEEPPPPKPKPAPVESPPAPIAADVAQLRTHALAKLHAEIDARAPIVIRVAAKPVVATDPDSALDARIESIEVSGKRVTLDTPLLERDPRMNLTYLGDRSAELRLCKIAATHAGVDDLSKHFVIVAPTMPLRELPAALTEGLKLDVARCNDLRGIASLVDPAALPKVDPAAGSSSGSGSNAPISP